MQCGYVGLALHRSLPLAEVVLTEVGDGMEHLAHNAALNGGEGRAPPAVAELDWRSFGAGEPHPGLGDVRWDVVVGSDLVYEEAGVEMLPRVLGRLCDGGAVVFYCHTKHRYDMMDHDFVANVQALGLELVETRRGDEASPSPSPPPFEHLFNEPRLVVWRISRP